MSLSPGAVRGHQVHLVRGFSGMAVRRNHDPGSFMRERKVEECICPASIVYLIGQYSPHLAPLVYPAHDNCPGSHAPFHPRPKVEGIQESLEHRPRERTKSPSNLRRYRRCGPWNYFLSSFSNSSDTDLPAQS
uniref:Uncharacterized protein n=1 Tax=Molossus molossus TaxID=27622 RepID=A0A7J8DCC7_MOLMO|nr:hypothetical protein HJG59_009376 [Molossus molossus]